MERHQEMAEQMDYEMYKGSSHRIVDSGKLRYYSQCFIETCDEFFEIELADRTIKTIFYVKDKYELLEERADITEVMEKHIHPDDTGKFLSMLEPETLEEMLEKRRTKRTEFRVKTVENTYVWVRGSFFAVRTEGKDRLLCYTYDIENEKQMDALAEEKEQILEAFINSYAAVIEVDLCSGTAYILNGKMKDKKKMPFSYFVSRMANDYVFGSDREKIKKFLDLSRLEGMERSKEENFLDVRVKAGGSGFEWIRLIHLNLSVIGGRLYLAVKNIHREHLQKTIIENFVYKHCDYLYYVDMKNNYYFRVAGNDAMEPMPDKSGNDYIKSMIWYVKDYVVPEEQREVIEKMMPEYVLDRLDCEGYFNITEGIRDAGGQYRRKQIQLRYYDRENRIVLIQRNDITENYNYKKKQKKEMEEVKKEAVTDFLTGIYNRTGCEKMIRRYMREETAGNLSAFILIDLDNFKRINDYMGHLKGDEVLREIGHILRRSFRNSDITARIGGDEFVVFMKNIRSRENVLASIKNLIQKLNREYEAGGCRIRIGASAGIALAPDDGTDFRTLYAKADKALYKVKYQGKNSCCIYSENK